MIEFSPGGAPFAREMVATVAASCMCSKGGCRWTRVGRGRLLEAGDCAYVDSQVRNGLERSGKGSLQNSRRVPRHL